MTNWSILAAAGRRNTFFRGSTASTKPSPPPSSRTSTQSPTSGLSPSRRNLPRARHPEHLASGVHVIEATEGLFNAPPTQKTISCVGEDTAELSLMQVK